MPSSYTSSLRLTLPVTGSLTGAWGDTVNNGITTLLDNAVAGSVTVTMTADTNHTLTVSSGATDQSRYMFINLSGGPHTITTNVICPAVSKLYVVTNNTSGSQSILFKTSAGTGVTIANGGRVILYCDGTNVTSVDGIQSLSTGALSLLTSDVNVNTSASTTGFSGFTAGIESSFQNTTLGMYGDTATGTTAGVSRASLGVLTFGLASAGMINTDFAGAPLYFATNSGLKLSLQDAGTATLYGNGTEGGELRFNNLDNASVGGILDVSVANTLRLRTGQNNSVIQVGQLGAGLTGGIVQFITENTEKMRITATGEVGIGTATPIFGKLHVNGGNIFVNGGVAGGIATIARNTDATAGSYSGIAFWNDQNPFAGYSASLAYFSNASATPNEFRISQNTTTAPMTFYTDGSQRLKLAGGSGTFEITNLGALYTSTINSLGYGACGGTVTQTGATTNSVTLHRPTGSIITYAGTYSANSTTTFLFFNDCIREEDTLIVNFRAPDILNNRANFQVWAAVGGTSYFAAIHIRNITGSSFSGSLQINFTVIRGSD